MADWLDVREAAERLGVEPVRVRQLIAAGSLSAEQWAGRWRVDADNVDLLAAQDRAAGRPYAPAVAWHVLAIIDDELRPPDLNRQQRARSQQYARHVARGHVAPLRNRAITHRGRVHRSLLDRLAGELVVSGSQAIPDDLPERLVDDEIVEGYVRAARWSQLAAEYRFQPAADATVVVHVVEDRLWAFDGDSGVASPTVAAIDLLERSDQRAVRAGRALLRRAAKALR